MLRRRYLHQKARMAYDAGELALADTFEAKRQAVAGTPLPPGFVNARTYTALTTAPIPYTTYEDLDGATAQEIALTARISRHTAQRALDELTTWLAANPAQALAFTRPDNSILTTVI